MSTVHGLGCVFIAYDIGFRNVTRTSDLSVVVFALSHKECTPATDVR